MKLYLPNITAATAILAAAVAHAAPQPAPATKASQPTGTARPSYTYSAMTTVRYATPNPRTSPVTTYLPSASMSAIMPSNLVTTTWQKGVSASDWNNPYGQAEWNRRWEPFMPDITISTFSVSTTVAPTPIPSASLIMPPDSGFQYGQLDPSMTFPSDFIFGVSDSAGQIEGALQDEGRTPSVLDYLNFEPGSEPNYVADWNYYYYKQDIARIAAMGVPYYYLTISWSRILPFGAKGTPVNKEGIDHYNDVINTCLEYGVKPVVAMVHADEPYEFVMGGGDVPRAYFSLNSGTANSTFVDSFVNYAQILFGTYGDRVPIWITINEPFYESGNLEGAYNLLEANAQVYHLYKSMGGKGMVSYKNADNFGVPLDPSNPSDVAATVRFQEYFLGIYSNPIFLGEDLPESVTSTLTNQSKKLTPQQLQRYKGTADFYAIDPYSATFVTTPPEGVDACAKDPSNPLWPLCVVPTLVDDNNWEIGSFYSESNVYYTATYFRSFMNWIWDTYKPSSIIASEFGYPSFKETEAPLAYQRQDLTRSLYYISYLTEILNCIHKDGINIIGALAWSALDDWEFSTYEQHFGLQTVNRTTMERTYKRSFFDFVNFFHDHGVSA